MNLCSSYSHLLSMHICAVPTRLGRAECRVHLLFSISRRPRCIAAVCCFLLRGCVSRPEDACQKRFSWFPDWIQKVQKLALVKSFQSSILVGLLVLFEWYYFLLAKIGFETAENEPLKVCQKLPKR